jgi:phosphohistidine phosphatase
MAELWPDPPEPSFRREFYLAGIDAVRSAVGELDDDVTTVMVIGHNPGWEELVGTLSGRDETMTTANAALLTVESDGWAIAMDGCWTLDAILRPKEL